MCREFFYKMLEYHSANDLPSLDSRVGEGV